MYSHIENKMREVRAGTVTWHKIIMLDHEVIEITSLYILFIFDYKASPKYELPNCV